MSIEDIYIKYYELLDAVGKQYKGSKHDTALIYIETMAGIEGRLNRANGVQALRDSGVSVKDIEA